MIDEDDNSNIVINSITDDNKLEKKYNKTIEKIDVIIPNNRA